MEHEKKEPEIEALPELTSEDVYTPRPRWQRILAWIMCAILIAGIALYYYWIMYKY